MLSRRDWLKAVAAGLAGCVAPPDALLLPDADPGHPLEPGPLEPDHVAATLEVGETDALVSVWAPRARWAVPIIEDIDTGLQTEGEPIPIDADAGGTGRGVLGELVAGRRYRWHARFDLGTTSEWYELRTAPPAAEPASFTFLYSADVDLGPQYDSPIFDTMAASGADFFVSLGDWPYADNGPAAVTVDDYRGKHRDARVHPRVRPLLRAMGLRCTWDDHEGKNNWDARFAANEPDRLAAAVQVWDEWFPLREPSAPRYRSWRWGAHAELFLLDTRLYRSANNAVDDAAKTMLGAEQKQWLIDGLVASPATFKLVFTTIPLDFGTDKDDWSLFTNERDQIFAALTYAGVQRVLFLSADQHWFAAHHHAAGFIEWQVGPLSRGFRAPGPLAPGVVARITSVYNYGEVVITDGDPAQLVFTARDPDGLPLYTETITA